MWIETSAEVYAVLMARHRKDLNVHSSFSDPTGTGYDFSTGRPEMITEWGFKTNDDNSLLKIIQTKENEAQIEWDCKYFIYN